MTSLKIPPREISEELLHSYCEGLHFYHLAAEHVETEPPSAFHLFEMVFDLMAVPSRDELLRLRIPNPRRAGDYWTRDELVKEFHRIYDDPGVPDEGFIRVYLDLLASLNPKPQEQGGPSSMAQA